MKKTLFLCFGLIFTNLLVAQQSVSINGPSTVEVGVQLYLQYKFGSVVRPVLELKDFQKVKLNAGESKTIEFIIDNQKLSFYNDKLEFVSEPGNFELMIGSSSADIRLRESFELVD